MSPPSSAEMSTFIFSRWMSSSRTSSPFIGPILYLGNRIATSGQTREHAGQSVTSPDLQRAFESSSKRDLSAFFAERVYPR